MTRKDYVLIADTIAQLSRDIAHDEGRALSDRARAVASGERAAVQTLTFRLAHELQLENPRFDRSRFIDACQLDAERLA
jgi:hypothetical protein